jgi:hypothetical protein
MGKDRVVAKPSFVAANEVAVQALDPLETIHRFINHLWQFMSAY